MGQEEMHEGVAILLNTNFEYEIENIDKDKDGNLLLLDFEVNKIKIRLINLYGPNSDDVDFYKNVRSLVTASHQDYVLLCGDFNLTLNPDLDSYNYVNINNPRSRQTLLKFMDENNLIDIYRHCYPSKVRYTWRRRRPTKQARLDYFIISAGMTDIIRNVDIKPGYRTDHSMLELSFEINPFSKGKGTWKFNTSLLKDQQYLTLIEKCIRNEYIKYAVPVYNNDYLQNQPFTDLDLTINYDLFLEVLLLSIRGETIKYATHKKRKSRELEKKLLSEIAWLEENKPVEKLDTIETKKTELENLRYIVMQGHQIRSRVEWVSEGEKPSKYFLALERHNYIDKTIKRIKRKDDTYITNQKEILAELRLFYSKLFKTQDHKLEEYDLNVLLQGCNVNKLTKSQTDHLGDPLTTEEIGFALKQMKNNKTPGIDGFPAEFFKIFWKDLKICITNALNCSFTKGTLPLTLRQCIITCLPKKGKPCECVKNWRPLSMLSVLYKLASASIANRIKPLLDNLIDKTQCGFVPGRYIGESTRLIYNIMHYTEVSQIPGMLVLIDFEKAFDSISWPFIYKVLRYLNFNENFIKWIKLFNCDVKASVIQCGFLSEFINIQRGCRQGDPISPYLFILAAQILAILILNNPDIKGIKCNNSVFKLTQFADDTTLILDGKVNSLTAALNTLEVFGNISGLKVNKDKTQIVWIGKKKHCKEKLLNLNFQWDICQFTLLGVKFSVDLEKCIELNYSTKLLEMKELINRWNRRKLTPLGNIVVIKSLLLSKLNLIFLCLPNPEKRLLEEVNNILFNFIWSNKPDKINRKTIVLDYHLGGLKMCNIVQFMQSLKATWYRRLIKDRNTPWLQLFQDTISSDLKRLFSLGPKYLELIIKKITNKFWVDVFNSWISICENQNEQFYFDLLASPLWFNERISKEIMFMPTWYRNGIEIVADVMNKFGNMLELDQLKHMYVIGHIDPLNYLTVKQNVNIFLYKVQTNDTTSIQRPVIPFYIKLALKATKGARVFYRTFNNNNSNDHSMKIKWNCEMNVDIDKETWCNIFNICHKAVNSTNLVWFQMKILYRILGTKSHLHKLGIKDNPSCSYCGCDETILHMFVKCESVKSIWKQLSKCIKDKINFSIIFNAWNIIFGYQFTDQNQKPLNALILVTKKFIFDTSINNKFRHMSMLCPRLETLIIDEEYLAKLLSKDLVFTNVWDKWKPMFCSI